ncbi:MAG: hypothetical protein U0869_02620 [Chloroflexota bacterium]
MVRTRSWLVLGGAAIVLAGVAPVAPAALAADAPVTLRFVVADGEDRPSDPYIRAFAKEVQRRTNGSVTLDIVWDGGFGTELGFEAGVASLVESGDADLGLAAGRGWAGAGVGAFDALQAPFLIDNDALALAVSSSPIADGMLAAAKDEGVIGLAMWPEDLRHPVAFEPCIAPITDPAQLAGRTVRATGSARTFQIIEALGAHPAFPNGYDDLVATCQVQAAESGLRQGASLPGHPTFTGDVTFFPKFQVLAANAAALDALTDAQRTAIQEAAVAVRDQAIAEHPAEADAAAAWCADGGTVVLAGPDAAAGFQAAASPVLSSMRSDPATAKAIDAITALKVTVPASPGAPACAPSTPASPQPVVTDDIAQPLPDGTWTATLTENALVASGMTAADAATWAGPKTLVIDGSSVSLASGDTSCSATQAVEGAAVRLDWSDAGGCNGTDLVFATLDGDLLTLVDLQSLPDIGAAAVLSAVPFHRAA